MKLVRLYVVTLAGVACAETASVDDLTLGDLVGTWDATAIQVTNNLDTVLQEDLFAQGVRWRLTVAAGGTFVAALANPIGTDSYAGTITVEGDSLILVSPDVAPPRVAMHYVYSAGALHLTWIGVEQCGSYGWTAPECPIPVTFRMSLRRQ